jgi:hypothetical protein
MISERYERPAVLMSYSSAELASNAGFCQTYDISDAALKDDVSVIRGSVASLSHIKTKG